MDSNMPLLLQQTNAGQEQFCATVFAICDDVLSPNVSPSKPRSMRACVLDAMLLHESSDAHHEL